MNVYHATHVGAERPRNPFASITVPAFLAGPQRPLCADHNPELWFDGDTEEGQRICRGCPLVLGCREWGKEHKEWGVWGGREPRKNGKFPKENECGHPERKHHGHGKCHACYSREKYQNRSVYPCAECGRKRTIEALGRCSACYKRIYRAAS